MIFYYKLIFLKESSILEGVFSNRNERLDANDHQLTIFKLKESCIIKIPI